GRGRGASPRPAVPKFFCGRDHDAAELHDGDVAGAEALPRAIGNRPHRLPHRGVLVRNTGDAGVTASLHRLAILEVVVSPGADGAEVAVQVDTDFRRAKLPPCALIDAFPVAPG